MTTTHKSPIRLACVLAAGGLLAACASDPSDTAVRNGPQAVHPSPSALAQGTPISGGACYGHEGNHCHTYNE